MSIEGLVCRPPWAGWFGPGPCTVGGGAFGVPRRGTGPGLVDAAVGHPWPRSPFFEGRFPPLHAHWVESEYGPGAEAVAVSYA